MRSSRTWLSGYFTGSNAPADPSDRRCVGPRREPSSVERWLRQGRVLSIFIVRYNHLFVKMDASWKLLEVPLKHLLNIFGINFVCHGNGKNIKVPSNLLLEGASFHNVRRSCCHLEFLFHKNGKTRLSLPLLRKTVWQELFLSHSHLFGKTM